MALEMTIGDKTTPLEVTETPTYSEMPVAEPAPTITRPAPRPAPDTSKTTRARTAAKTVKAEKPRVAKEPVVLETRDYTQALDGALTGVWVAAVSLPPTTAYAAVLDMNKDGLVNGLNLAANNSPTARRYVEKWTGGSGGLWTVTLAAIGVNMCMQTYQLSKDANLRSQLAEGQRAKLAEWAKAQGIGQELKVDDEQRKLAEDDSKQAG